MDWVSGESIPSPRFQSTLRLYKTPRISKKGFKKGYDRCGRIGLKDRQEVLEIGCLSLEK